MISLIERQKNTDPKTSNSLDKNVHNVAVDGSFDDCQDFVKELFGDTDIKRTHQLAAVNSINWARILAQMYVLFIFLTIPRSEVFCLLSILFKYLPTKALSLARARC